MDKEAYLAMIPFVLFSVFIAIIAVNGKTYLGKSFKRAQASSILWPISGFLTLGSFWVYMILAATDRIENPSTWVLFVALAFSVFLNAGFNFDIEE